MPSLPGRSGSAPSAPSALPVARPMPKGHPDSRSWEILDALPLPVAVLDGEGVVLAVNDHWIDQPAEHVGVGDSCLELWRSAAGSAPVTGDAARLLNGLRQVIDGEVEQCRLQHQDAHVLTHIRRHGGVIVLSRLRTTEPADLVSLRRLACLVDASGDAIIGVDTDRIITSWNIGAETMYGHSAEQAVGRSVEILAPKDAPGIRKEFLEALAEGRGVSAAQALARRRDGSHIEVSVTLSPVLDSSGRVAGTSAITRNITESQQQRAAAEHERDRLTFAQEIAHVGSVEVNMVTGRRWWSDEYFRIHGLPVTEEPTEELWHSVLHPEDRERVRQAWHDLEIGGPPLKLVHRILRPSGEVRWVHTRATAEHRDGVLVRLLETAVDITERKLAEEALQRLAFHDPLTGLANRALLAHRIEEELHDGERAGTQVGVLFLDVNRFKVVNDGLGHAAGDSLLIQLAARLRSAVRPTDTLARFAGDEFVIVCADLTLAAAHDLAGRIGAEVQVPFDLLGQELFVSVSIGIALSSPNATAESLLHQADAAMYFAKEAGRIDGVVFDESMHRQAETRLDIGSYLPRAAERGELELHYQPILRIDGRTPTGFEALLRWRHPKYGLVPPAEFIPVAEETGLIVELGRWVLENALTQAQAWRAQVPGASGLRIAVNLSARQLQDHGLVATVAEAMENAGIDPSAVELEITESAVMKDVERSMTTLTRLRSMGIGLSVDDFGTGYSSLSYLSRLPVTTLKIDRSFVEGLDGSDAHARPIVAAVTMMAGALGLDVVAEGVESEDHLRELETLGVGLAQGFLWAEPMPGHQVAPWLAASAAGTPFDPR
ncbi:putative bifunctional diguanylate cyclase/phosphodiesterase [Arthrobacter pityocampae]|uniref:putative bifunctional diguanylate cyclase/phosphodiesterase n=1 Tax=Arthrobacter pityocampae TaxID=547334 RepID=UPI0037350218